MNNFIKTPNLPEKRVTLAAVGEYPHIIDALRKEGIKTVSFSSSELFDEVKRHQDMLLCHTGKDIIFLDPAQDSKALTEEGFTVRFSSPSGESYPDNVKLNCAVSDTFFICNRKTVDTSLHDSLIQDGKKPIYVNQGYAKCSVCFVTENAVITEDRGIYEALERGAIDTLLISKGDIYLSDTHYGFFGGSTGKTDKNTLAVTGKLSYHKDGKEISDFCKKHGVRIKELTDGKIIDVGSILPLKEMR